MRFTWDESKRQINLSKHGLDFADAARVFDGPLVLSRTTATIMANNA